MAMYDVQVRNALTRERLFTETVLDVVQDLLVGRVRLVEDVPEREIRRAEAITEMLREDPTAVSVCSQVNKSNARSRDEAHTHKHKRHPGSHG
jgi:hypothetical protein